MAAVSRGVSEFLAEGERLQPKVQPRSPGAVRMLWVSGGGGGGGCHSPSCPSLPNPPSQQVGEREGMKEQLRVRPSEGEGGEEGGCVPLRPGLGAAMQQLCFPRQLSLGYGEGRGTGIKAAN